jgi:hypothetical protein
VRGRGSRSSSWVRRAIAAFSVSLALLAAPRAHAAVVAAPFELWLVEPASCPAPDPCRAKAAVVAPSIDQPVLLGMGLWTVALLLVRAKSRANP